MLVAEHVPFSSPTGSRKRSQHLETVPHADKFALDHVAKVHRLLPVASTVAEQAVSASPIAFPSLIGCQ